MDKKNHNEGLISKEEKEWVKFMNDHRSTPDTEQTHTLMGSLHPKLCTGKGSFSIDDESQAKFYELYKKMITKIQMHVVERPKKIGQMIIDIDFKVPRKYKERQYLDEHIELIIQSYVKMFRKYLDVETEQLDAFVFEKAEPTYEEKHNLFKDGFHIIFPKLALNVEMRYFFFNKTKEEMIEDDIFANIPIANTYDEIFDPSVLINNGILMYGSCKEGRTPYYLTKIYDYKLRPKLTNEYDNYDLVDILSSRKFVNNELLIFKKRYKNAIKEYNEKKEQPIYNNDDNSDDEKTNRKTNNISPIKTNVEQEEKEKKGAFDPENKMERDLYFCREVVKILSVERATVYQDWISVGWALHAVSYKLKDAFVEFSKKCSGKFDQSACDKVWNDANRTKSNYTISSLHWWGKQDDLVKYTDIMRELLKHIIIKAESGTHVDLANMIFEMCGSMWKCVHIQRNIWFEFNGFSWQKINGGYTLINYITEVVTKEFWTIQHFYSLNSSVTGSLDFETLKKKTEMSKKIYTNLKTEGFLASVLGSCARKFHDPHFEEKLDANPLLVGFTNGVFDLNLGKFRAGTPDDYVFKTTKYDYQDFDEESTEIKEVLKYFSQVQKDPEMKEYVLKLLASFMDGSVRDQQLIIWTGSGCHAKDEEIKMFDGTVKKIQNIKLGEKILGADGRHRKVVVTYKGKTIMYNIKSSDDISFKVTENHRLAVRCHFKPYIYETIDDASNNTIYWVKIHEILDGCPCETDMQFLNKNDAEKYLNNIDKQTNIMQYGEIIPIYVENLQYIQKEILNLYKLVKYNCDINCDVNFIFEKIDKQQFFGVELDGDKKYVMNNGFITYNSNGKSTTVDLVHATMGDYGGVLPTTVITRRRGQVGGATPELADKCGKRFLVIQEPEHDDTVYVGQMKELTGGDTIYARALYGDPFEYKPMFKLILLCNRLPFIPSSDGGTWRRLRVCPWETEFVDGEPKEQHQVKKDKSMIAKLKKLNVAFAWLLLNIYYPKYMTETLNEPEKVLMYSKKYEQQSDIYAEFVKEILVKTDKNDDKIERKWLYDIFKEWFKSAYTKTPPPRKELFDYIEKKKFNIIGSELIGYKEK